MKTLEWLSHLIASDTTSRNSNLQMIDLIRDWLARRGVHDLRLTYDAQKKKANLFATLPSKRGNLEGGLILSGHTDVVPVDGQKWDTDPFKATLVQDRVYGRGTCDMKGFLAVVLSLVPEFQKWKLEKPLHMSFTYDEEVGCLGAPLLIDDLKRASIHPAACIVGEPTNMQPVIAHKGIQVVRCRVHGKAAHSSLTTAGCNAIDSMARLISYIRSLADKMQKAGPFDPCFDVPCTTISSNLIRGGAAVNIVPDFCELHFEFRQLPGVDPQSILEPIRAFIKNELLPDMQREKSDSSIELELIAAVPSFEASESAPITQIVRAISQEKGTHKVSYTTEAGLFQQAHTPTLLWGPGSIEQAHRPNEYVLLSQLAKCETSLRQLVHQFCTP